jgi:hypothetical protein
VTLVKVATLCGPKWRIGCAPASRRQPWVTATIRPPTTSGFSIAGHALTAHGGNCYRPVLLAVFSCWPTSFFRVAGPAVAFPAGFGQNGGCRGVATRHEGAVCDAGSSLDGRLGVRPVRLPDRLETFSGFKLPDQRNPDGFLWTPPLNFFARPILTNIRPHKSSRKLDLWPEVCCLTCSKKEISFFNFTKGVC